MSRRPLYNIFFCQKNESKEHSFVLFEAIFLLTALSLFLFPFFSWADYIIPRLFEIKGGVAKNVSNQNEFKRKAEISLLGF